MVKKEWGFKAYNDLKHQGFDVGVAKYVHLGHSAAPRNERHIHLSKSQALEIEKARASRRSQRMVAGARIMIKLLVSYPLL